MNGTQQSGHNIAAARVANQSPVLLGLTHEVAAARRSQRKRYRSKALILASQYAMTHFAQYLPVWTTVAMLHGCTGTLPDAERHERY
jgi:hypothetical protein